MKNLAPNNKLLKIATPVLFTVIGIILCTVLLKHNLLWLLLGLLLVVGVGVLIIVIDYKKTANLFYDTNFFYLKNNGETRKVKLTAIKRVKLTPSNQKIVGFRLDKYQIEFVSGTKMIETVTFWVGSGTYLLEFEKHLNFYSPKTITEHRASTFYP